MNDYDVSQLAKLQSEFQSYLLDDTKSSKFLSAVVDDHKVGAKKRLSIYHDAYRLRIIEALSTAYPQLKALLGDVLFNKISLEYINAYPSNYRNLRWYGSEMCKHLMLMLPEHPIAAEMADFEWKLSLAFDAADVTELGLKDLSAIPPEEWGALYFRFQPAINIVRTRWNTISMWQELEAGEIHSKPTQHSTYQSWIIWRKGFISQFRQITELEVTALDFARSGESFSEICGFIDTGEDTAIRTAAQYLGGWLEAGLIYEVLKKQL